MSISNDKIKNVDEYIAGFDPGVQNILKHIRMVIQKAAPGAVESIAYDMPAYTYNDKPLVYFAAFQNHIGFYATPEANEEFATKLAQYKHGKGSIRFPLNEPMPYELISEMVAYKAKILNDSNFGHSSAV